MKTFFKKTMLLAAVAAGMLTSCVNDDDYDVPNLACEETDLVANMEPQDVPATATVQQYEDNESIPGDDIIEAYVTSSDLGGNFFKSISFQTLDGSFGFSVPVDVVSTFIKFEPGRKVLIKLDNTVYTDIKFGSLRIGALYEGGSTPEVGRMSVTQYEDVLNRSCTVVSEEELVQKLTISETLNNSRINTLIELQNVHFREDAVGNTYYDEGNQLGGATNHILVDEAGNEIIFRTSSFADYAASIVPGGTGNVRGVLTKFNNDFQFVSRTEDDIKITDEQVPGEPGEPGEPGDSETAIGGTDIQYLANFTENFESYNTPEVINYGAGPYTTFPKYVNDAASGPRYWAITGFQGNKYIQMSAHNTGSQCTTYFAVPADLTNANLSFKTKDGYNNGNVLKVYYSTTYVAGGTVNEADLVDITDNFNIASSAPANGYASNFTSSGSYSIPATGNGFIIFEYSGNANGGPTTTMQIDDIVVN